MASPSVSSEAENAVTTAGTSHTVTFTQTTGHLVVVWIATAAAVSFTCDEAVFTKLYPSSGTDRLHIWYGELSGTEGGNAVFTSSGSTKSAWVSLNITGFDGSTAPEMGTAATGTSISPNCPSLSPSGGSKDYLWIAGFRQAGEEDDDDTWQNYTPTGTGGGSYSPSLGYQKTSGVSGAASTNCQICVGYRQYTGSSEDPSVWDTDQSLAWTAQTIAVYPTTTTKTRTSTADVKVGNPGRKISESRRFTPDVKVSAPSRKISESRAYTQNVTLLSPGRIVSESRRSIQDVKISASPRKSSFSRSFPYGVKLGITRLESISRSITAGVAIGYTILKGRGKTCLAGISLALSDVHSISRTFSYSMGLSSSLIRGVTRTVLYELLLTASNLASKITVFSRTSTCGIQLVVSKPFQWARTFSYGIDVLGFGREKRMEMEPGADPGDTEKDIPA